MTTATLLLPARALAAGEGRTLSVLGNRLTFTVTSADSNGELLALEYVAPAGFAGPPPHIHERTDELFYVLEGAITGHLAGQTVRIAQGGTLFVPRGVPHTFSNPNDAPGRYLIVMTPAGFEGYFDELAQILAAEGTDHAAAISALQGKYDQAPANL